jgi:hypothetical protein
LRDPKIFKQLRVFIISSSESTKNMPPHIPSFKLCKPTYFHGFSYSYLIGPKV